MRYKILAGLFVFLLLLVPGCNGSLAQNSENSIVSKKPTDAGASAAVDYTTLAKSITMPTQPKTDAAVAEGYTIDLSNTSQGYVTVSSDSIPQKKIKVQIAKDDEKYNYDFTGEDEFTTYPLQLGDGVYRITIYENIESDKYAEITATEAEVRLENEFVPYLLPNQIVQYTTESKAVYQSFALCDAASTDLERVGNVYGFIVDNIVYDQPKADNLVSGYLPDVDETLFSKKGICYDYSALLACMLRTEKIPTRLVMGYVSGVDVYHAWNEIYITDVGWVRTSIYFDGQNWQTADSTFGAGGSTQAVGKDMEYTRVKWY